MRFRSVHAVAFILLSAYCLIGCDFAVFDDLVSCPQGVSFHFYRQTPCEQFPNYPSDIRQVRVFAFDANGVLVGEFSDKKVLLSADYSLSATLQHTLLLQPVLLAVAPEAQVSAFESSSLP